MNQKLKLMEAFNTVIGSRIKILHSDIDIICTRIRYKFSDASSRQSVLDAFQARYIARIERDWNDEEAMYDKLLNFPSGTTAEKRVGVKSEIRKDISGSIEHILGIR